MWRIPERIAIFVLGNVFSEFAWRRELTAVSIFSQIQF